MKKILSLLVPIVTLSLTGCGYNYMEDSSFDPVNRVLYLSMGKGGLETIDTTSYIKEETIANAHKRTVFCIVSSFDANYLETSFQVQRYIFLGQNGPFGSYKINDIHTGSEDPTNPHYSEYTSHVYFKYIAEDETPYMEYGYYCGEHTKGYDYWLYLPKSTVLEVTSNMFKEA